MAGKKLTLKPTSLTLHRLVKQQVLVPRTSLRDPTTRRRSLYVTPEISSLLDGENPKLGFPAPEAETICSQFILGWHLIVSRKMNIPANLEWLEGVDEVWTLCFRKPRPGWRILGRFESKDTFVGLHAYDRHELGSVQSYTEKAKLIPGEWQAHFGSIEPLRGKTVDEYVSEPYWVDDGDDEE